ncbi:SDR family NAD(P)-dependent oxidoreductase [Nocardia thraciensis]
MCSTTIAVSSADVALFAEASGDRNPLHCDPAYAHATPFGRPIAHGVLVLLAALATLPAGPHRIRRLECRFDGSMNPDQQYETTLRDDGDRATIQVRDGRRVLLTAVVYYAATVADNGGQEPVAGEPEDVSDIGAPRAQAAVVPLAEITTGWRCAVDFPSGHPKLDELGARWDLRSRGLGAAELAALGWCSYLVGMELPGRSALLAGIDIDFDVHGGRSVPVFRGRAECAGVDATFRMVRLASIAEFGRTRAHIRLQARVRHDEIDAPSVTMTAQLNGTGPVVGNKVALVVGGSRGLGAAAVHALASRGFVVYVGYRYSTPAAERMRSALGDGAERVELLPGDAADPEWSDSAAERIRREHGGLDVLVLNAVEPPPLLPLAACATDRATDYVSRAVALAQAPLAALLDMVADRAGRIIAVSSSAITDPVAGWAHYTAAKAAVEGLVRSAAIERPEAGYLVVRPPRMQTALTSAASDATSALRPESVAAAIMEWIEAPCAHGEVAIVDTFTDALRRVAVAATFTADTVAEVAREKLLSLDGTDIQPAFAPYGQVIQTLLDATSVLAVNRRGINWILLRVEDWLADDKPASSRRETDDFCDAVAQFQRHDGDRPPLLIQICPPSPRTTVSAERARNIEDATSHAVERLMEISGVHVLTGESWYGSYRVAGDYDPIRDELAGIPYSPDVVDLLGTAAARAIHALAYTPRKVMVVDADHTLWQGAVGEDGVDGVTIGPGHMYLQRRIASWAAEGVLVCVCSKNELADVRAVFDRADMPLDADSVVGWRVNWLPKPENLRSLATELNLHLDSFVFVDDNEVEVAAVRAALPEVLALTVPADESRLPGFVDDLWAFDRMKVTSEDRRRVAMYRDEARRAAYRQETMSLESFLAGLDLRVTVRDADEPDIARLAQLSVRTNQFTLTGRRYAEQELRDHREAGATVLAVEVRDRFGDYGLTGMILAHPDGDSLVVTSMALSCRVLGRGVEGQVLAALHRRAHELRLTHIDLQVRRTARNQPAREFAAAIDAIEHTTTGGLVVYRTAVAETTKTSTAQEDPSPAPDDDATLQALREVLAVVGSVPAQQLTADTRLGDVLHSSLAIAEATAQLIEKIGPVPKTVLFDNTTIGAAAQTLAGKHAQPRRPLVPAETPAAADDPIAIVGIAGRYPGAATVEDLWPVLSEGRSAVTTLPPERWQHARFYARNPQAHQTNSRWAGLLTEIDRFDPETFEISPREADQMDPQQRLFLEVAYEAVQNAGYSRRSVDRRSGVYVGVMAHDYGTYLNSGALVGTASHPYAEHYQVANRVSYFLDLTGPSMAVDTACSSSGTALALACEAVRAGTVPMAVAGGVNLLVHPARFVQYTRMGMLSPRGRCRAFGVGADGIVLGEGVGAVVLKRLSTALADGDTVRGVIRGWKTNSGGRTNGFTVPNPAAQAALVRDALAHAGCPPDTIGYVEAHGTGTPLGDPIEIHGLADAFAPTDPTTHRCAVGSVKTNIGHLESAAAIAGLSKVLLQFEHGMIAPSLYARRANPDIDFASTPFFVPDRPLPFPDSHPRRAGLSSFGAGGANTHFVVEEFVPPPGAPLHAIDTEQPHLFVISAPNEALLSRYARRLRHRLREHSYALRDIAYTLRSGRDPRARRAAVIAADTTELLPALDHLATTPAAGQIIIGGSNDATPRSEHERGLADLAQRWIDGTDIDWDAELPREHAERVPLPSCPYRRTRHWLPDASETADQVAAASVVPWLLTGEDQHELQRRCGELLSETDRATSFDAVRTGHRLATTQPRRHRAVILGQAHSDFIHDLQALRSGASTPGIIRGVAVEGATAFLFSGQGSHRTGMGRELYDEFPDFARIFDDICAQFDPELDVPLRDVVFADSAGPHAALLEQQTYTQPALFALEVALCRLLLAWELHPQFLIGHSLGEIAAAHIAGVFALPDACRLVLGRGRLMHALPTGGAMLAVRVPEDSLPPLLAGREHRIDVAAVNGPDAVVLSGDDDEITRLAEELADHKPRRLPVPLAMHSAHIDPILTEFERIAAELHYTPPQIPLVSNVTGELAVTGDIDTPQYWVRHVRRTVRFRAGIETLHQLGATRYLELGPDGVLTALVRECRKPTPLAVPVLRRNLPEPQTLLTALAQATVDGHSPDWSRIFGQWSPHQPSGNAKTATGQQYRVEWRPSTVEPAPPPAGPTLLLRPAECGNNHDLIRVCRSGLRAHGVQTVELAIRQDEDRAAIAERLTAVAATHPEPATVLSLLSMADNADSPGDPSAPAVSTLTTLQALGDAEIAAPVWCVTRGAVPAGTYGAEDPLQAQVWGLGRTAALEWPRRWGGLVDVTPSLDEHDIGDLLAVVSGTAGDDEWAIRPDGIFVRRLLPVDDDRDDDGTWDIRGTALVTGGTGALGSATARWLAGRGAEHLVLVSRHGGNAAQAAELKEELGRLGVAVTFAACDVADRAALAALLDSIPSEPPLTTIVHAAGLAEECALDSLTATDLARNLRPKVHGALHLHDLTRDRNVSTFVLFSSITGVWGGSGYGAYAAANSFLDAFAAARRAHGMPATAVAWGPWDGAGISAYPTVRVGLDRAGWIPMPPESALDALQRTLDHHETSAVVANIDWHRFAGLRAAIRPTRSIDELPAARDTRTREVPSPSAPPTLPPGFERLSEPGQQRTVRDLVRRQTAAALGHPDIGAIRLDVTFRELGLDSPAAVELCDRLNTATGLQLPASTVFDHPTPADLAIHVRNQLCPASEPELARPESDIAGDHRGIDTMDTDDLVRLALGEDPTPPTGPAFEERDM